MNKYMGFYELKAINLPTVSWKLFDADTVLDGGFLWTVRVALEGSNDLNLPRAVGVTAQEAEKKGRELLKIYEGKGIVLYYPFFIAQKSGVLDISQQRTVIEAVDKDLWNLVTYGRRNVTAVIPFITPDTAFTGNTENCTRALLSGSREMQEVRSIQYDGDETFLSSGELKELLGSGAVIRGRFRDSLSEGKSILAEWSYAFSTDISLNPAGERYLVFYELREV